MSLGPAIILSSLAAVAAPAAEPAFDALATSALEQVQELENGTAQLRELLSQGEGSLDNLRDRLLTIESLAQELQLGTQELVLQHSSTEEWRKEFALLAHHVVEHAERLSDAAIRVCEKGEGLETVAVHSREMALEEMRFLMDEAEAVYQSFQVAFVDVQDGYQKIHDTGDAVEQMMQTKAAFDREVEGARVAMHEMSELADSMVDAVSAADALRKSFLASKSDIDASIAASEEEKEQRMARGSLVAGYEVLDRRLFALEATAVRLSGKMEELCRAFEHSEEVVQGFWEGERFQRLADLAEESCDAMVDLLQLVEIAQQDHGAAADCMAKHDPSTAPGFAIHHAPQYIDPFLDEELHPIAELGWPSEDVR